MSVSVTTTWLEARRAAQRRAHARGFALSCALHLGIGALFVAAPRIEPTRLPEVISVRMVSLPEPVAAAAAKAATPAPLPARPRPAPVPKKVILPKQPAAVSKKPKRKAKPKPLDYDEAMAALRKELGEELDERPDEPPPAPAEPTPIAELPVRELEHSGPKADAAVLAWRLATRRHLKRVWVVPPEFLNQLLWTELIVSLSEAGDVLGTPEIVASAGNPYFDDNTVRALIRASPLPPPPEPGAWPFHFKADEGQ